MTFNRQQKILISLLLFAMGVSLTAFAQTQTTDEAMREDLSRLTANSPSGAVMKRQPKGNICALSAPFELLACGPMTTISLALTPGMFGSLDQTTTRGGLAAQFMDQLQAMDAAAGPSLLDDLARQADAVDGSSITIVIPLIDYGFTGSFGNAAISMNRANTETHDGVYQAIGPRDSMPGPDQAFPLSGNVTIEEYSPWVLRGTFSGAMVDMSQSNLAVDDPVLNVVHQLSGTFNVIGPWRGDERAVLISDEDMERTARQDAGSVFEGASGTDDTGAPSSSTPAAGGSGGLPGAVASCDCSCNVARSAAPACLQQCEGTFQACQGIPLAMLSDQQLASAASLGDLAAEYELELRERFEVYLRKRWSGQPKVDEIVDGYLESFDDAIDLNARATITASAGLPMDCDPPGEVAEKMAMAQFMYCR